MWQHRQGKQEGTFQVPFYHRVPFLFGLRQRRIGGNHPGKSGVVNQDIHRAEIGCQLGDDVFHRPTAAQVRRIVAGSGANLLRRLLQALRVARHDGDAVILLRQLLSDGQPNTAGTAGNNRCTLRHNCSPFSPGAPEWRSTVRSGKYWLLLLIHPILYLCFQNTKKVLRD
ncbi:hypothetical protein D3C73_940000 [compost metagenome]